MSKLSLSRVLTELTPRVAPYEGDEDMNGASDGIPQGAFVEKPGRLELINSMKDLVGKIDKNKFYHMSPNPLDINSIEYTQQYPNEIKPRGFWFAKGDSWFDFITQDWNHMHNFIGAYVYIVDIDFRYLASAEDINYRDPNWPEVAKHYDGVYDENADLKYFDILNSGCVWVPDAIKSISPFSDPKT